MKAAPRARFDGPAMIFLAVALLVTLHAVWQAWLVAAAPYPAVYDYDEGVYAESAAAAAGGGQLYTGVFLSQPPFLIGVLAHAFAAFGRSLASARGVVVAFSALWLAGIAAIAGFAPGSRAAVWAVAIAAPAPAFVLASHTVQMEAPAEALAALAVALSLAAAGRDGGTGQVPWASTARWSAAGLAAGLAAMTKFSALTCLIPLAMAAATGAGTASPRRTAARAASVAGGAALGAAAVLAWTGSPPAAMWRQTVAFHGAVARVTSIDPGQAAALLSGFAQANWLAVALGLAGFAYTLGTWRRAPDPRRAVAAWLAADVAAVLLWRPVWAHHLAILMTPLAVLAAGAAEAVRHRAAQIGAAASIRPRRTAARLAAGALIGGWLVALAATCAAARPEISAPLRAAAAQIRRAVPAGGSVVADDPLIAFLAGRTVPSALCDTSEMRMRAGWLTARTLTAALADPQVRGVVFWRGTFLRLVPGFVDEAAKRFPRRWAAGAGRLILTR